MIIIKNINLENKEEGWKVTNDNFKKISTMMDNKESFITISDEDVQPIIIEKENVTLIKNLFLDINEKSSIIGKARHINVFDDTGMIIRYRAPKDKTINNINKFSNTTSIRYIKKSEDKSEVLVLATYRFNYYLNGETNIVSNKYDGILEFELSDGTKELVYPTDRIFEIDRKSSPVKIISTCINNILYINERDNKTTIQELLQNFNLSNTNYKIVNNEKDLHSALKQSCFNEIFFKNVKKDDIEKILLKINHRFRAKTVSPRFIRTLKVQFSKNLK